MPTRPPRACPHTGCTRSLPCPLHPRDRWAEGASGYERDGWAWAETVKRVLARDRFVCYVCLLDVAVTADHVIPVAEGGSSDDSNVAAICARCHAIKSQAEALRGRRRRR